MTPITQLQAFKLGFIEMLRGEFGRTWQKDQDLNEAYDRGGNFAEELFEGGKS